jgi:cytochrome c oxidase assembly factor CtaG
MASTTTPRTRTGSPAGRGLLAVGCAVLAGTVAVLAVAVVHQLVSPMATMPVDWVRSAGDRLLPPLTARRWLTAWQFDAVATVLVVGVAAVYLSAVVACHKRGRRWPVWRTLSFLAGLGVCLLAVSSVIGVYDMALFTTHMIGHLLLVMVAPPLLVLGRPLVLALHAVGNPWHTRLKRFFRGPVVSLWFSAPMALATYLVTIVGTHLTGLMDVIMEHPWAGQVEHLAYVVIGYQFFAVCFGDEPYRWSLTPMTKEFMLAIAMGVDTFTGVILFQTTNEAVSMRGVAGASVDHVVQTQDGGAVMWVGGDSIMVLVMIAIAIGWLRRPDLRRRAASGWIGQARNATLSSHTTAGPSTAGTVAAGLPASRVQTLDVDEDDTTLAGYNAWLQGLAARRSEH